MTKPKEKNPGTISIEILAERYKKLPEDLQWHPIEKGDTLERIANDFGWSLDELLLANWRLSSRKEDKEKVNWYLRKYVGCTKDDGNGSYIFTGNEKNKKHFGRIKVPKVVGLGPKIPPKEAKQPRDGTGTVDTLLQVAVFEATPEWGRLEVSDKFLYVFSGAGYDFGYKEPKPLPKNHESNKESDQFGSAYGLDFPGYFNLDPNIKPDTLEAEIYISGEAKPDKEDIKMLSGSDNIGKSKIEYPNKWYFSDSAELSKATAESRHKRWNFQKREFKTVQIKNLKGRRFYFLLSPVKLGPEAIKFAMANPNGLTPLLKHNAASRKKAHVKADDDTQTTVVDPANETPAFDPNSSIENAGPTPDDIKQSPISLRVIDPYSWAEYIATEILSRRKKEYEEWFGAKKTSTTDDLKKITGWSVDHLFVAEMLKMVADNYPEKGAIESELKNQITWISNMHIWKTKMHDKNASILANLHQALMQIIMWLKSPAHKIIETAIVKDTDFDNPADVRDVKIGLTHWAICIENMFTFEPGIVYLNEVLHKGDSVIYDIFLKYYDAFPASAKPALQIGWMMANDDVPLILSLRDLVTLKKLNFTGSPQQIAAQKAFYFQQQTNVRVAFFNSHKVFPGEVQAAPIIPAQKPANWTWTRASTALLTTLDLVDKGINLRYNAKVAAAEANAKISAGIAEYVKKHESDVYEIAAAANKSYEKANKRLFFKTRVIGWVFKAGTTSFAAYNFFTAMATLRNDWETGQDTISRADVANNTAGFLLALQDTLVEIADVMAVHAGKEGMKKWFPSFMKIEGNKFVPIKPTTLYGRLFAGSTIALQVVMGLATMYSMDQSRKKASSYGDYTAAWWYGAGETGGGMMVGGALIWGIALMSAGARLGTAGVVIMVIGGIIAFFAGIFGSKNESDDWILFARKCFLGKGGDDKPSFGDKPPAWSFAPTSEEWAIEQQKEAIINLLCRFTVRTYTDSSLNTVDSKFNTYDSDNKSYTGELNYEIIPGLLVPGSIVEIEMFYENKSEKASVDMKWIGPRQNNPFNSDYEFVRLEQNDLFDYEKTKASFQVSEDSVSGIYLWIEKMNFQDKKDSVLRTTVTIRQPIYDNTIQAKKEVMSFTHYSENPNKIKQLNVANDPVISNIFD